MPQQLVLTKPGGWWPAAGVHRFSWVVSCFFHGARGFSWCYGLLWLSMALRMNISSRCWVAEFCWFAAMLGMAGIVGTVEWIQPYLLRWIISIILDPLCSSRLGRWATLVCTRENQLVHTRSSLTRPCTRTFSLLAVTTFTTFTTLLLLLLPPPPLLLLYYYFFTTTTTILLLLLLLLYYYYYY